VVRSGRGTWATAGGAAVVVGTYLTVGWVGEMTGNGAPPPPSAPFVLAWTIAWLLGGAAVVAGTFRRRPGPGRAPGPGAFWLAAVGLVLLIVAVAPAWSVALEPCPASGPYLCPGPTNCTTPAPPVAGPCGIPTPTVAYGLFVGLPGVVLTLAGAMASRVPLR